MLVRFSNKKASISMHDHDAKAMIKMMNMSGKIPSAISAEDLPAATSALKSALKASVTDHPDNDDLNVSQATHAGPLLELLEQSIKGNLGVMWENQGSSL